jgi:anti-sigma factor RsiW
MKCDRAREMMQEYVDGLLSPVVAVELEDHAADCPRCKSELSGLLRLCESISLMPRVEPEFDTVNTIRERIADLPQESFAWPVLPQRERPRVWALAAFLWLAVLAAGLLSYWSQVAAVASRGGNAVSGAGQWVWGHLSGGAGEVLSALAPIGRAIHSAAADFLAGAGAGHALAYVAGFLAACLLIVAADRSRKLRTAAGTAQIFS